MNTLWGFTNLTVFLKMVHSRPLYLYFCTFNTENVLYKNSPMIGFEPRTSGIRSDCSANCATITAHKLTVCTAKWPKKGLKKIFCSKSISIEANHFIHGQGFDVAKVFGPWWLSSGQCDAFYSDDLCSNPAHISLYIICVKKQ